MANKSLKVAFSLKQETRDAIYTLYESLKQTNTVGTFDDYFNELLDSYNSKRSNTAKLEEQIKELQEQLTAKETQTADEELLQEVEHLKEVLKNETECKQQAYNELTNLKSKYQILTDDFNEISRDDANIIKVNFGNYRPLISNTVKRLNKKYNREDITADKLLFTMFMRYTVERLTNIFYPFVLSDREIEEITGKPIEEIKNFFKK